MILAEHRHHQPSRTDDPEVNGEEISLSNNVASWQSANHKANQIEEMAVVHRQPENQQIDHVDDDDDDDDDDDNDEDSFTYPSSDDDEDDNKQNWVAKRLPEIPKPSVNNQISNSNKVNISNTNKNVYEGSVIIHQNFYNNRPASVDNPDGIDVVPMEKITNGNNGKDPEAAVGPKLSNVSSHPLYPFTQDKVSSWCTKRRLIAISAAVLAGVAVIILIVYLTMPGTKKIEYVPSPPNDSSTNNGESYILGVPYVERKKWVAQPPVAPANKLKIFPPEYVIISHTATEFCYDRGECVRNVRFIQNFHIESQGWDDIAYNFLVGGDGAIYEGRGWDTEGAHTFNYNIKSIGISFVGTFTKFKPTDVQLYAAEKLIEYALQTGRLAENYKLLGHRQCIKTESPGQKLYDIIKTWPHWSPTP